MEFTLLAAAAMAAFGFWSMLRWEAKRGNAAGCAVDLWDAGIVSAMAGLFIGRVAAMLQTGINPLAHPMQVLLLRSGVSTTAASIGAIAVFAFISRKQLWEAADAVAPAALAGLAGWHAGCIPTGSCLGTESSLPWAFALEGSTVTRHPVEIYAALVFLIGASALALWKQHGRPPLAAPAGIGLAVAGGVRLVTEPLRISLSGGPVMLYATGLTTGIAITVWALWSDRKREPSPTNP